MNIRFTARVFTSWGLPWLFLGWTAMAAAADRYVQVGSLVTTWDTFAHRSNTNLSTFPDNCSSIVGSTRLKNGNVACLFAMGISSPAPRGLVFYVFSIDPAKNPAWKIVDGPYKIDFQVPGWLFGGLSGGITEFGAGRFILTATGAFPIDDEHFYRKYYWLAWNGPGSQPSVYHEFPTNMNSVLGFSGELAYLPTDGQDPDAFAVSSGRDYALFDTAGNYLRTITAQSLGLSYRVDQASQHGSLEVSDNGDLLALDNDVTVGGGTGTVHWEYLVCVRFDRYGNWKGSWGFGASLMDNPPEDGFTCFAQLSNGDFYASTFQALYLVGASNPETGNAHTYRHFIVRPPVGFSQPVLHLSTTNVNFIRQVINRTHLATVRLSNPGSAPLQLHSLKLSGDTNVFQLTSLVPMTLDPGYSQLDATNAFVDCSVAFSPTKPGPYRAQLEISSSDPVNPTQTVSLAAFGVPTRFSLPTLVAATNVWPAPIHPTGMCLGADGESALFMLAVMAQDGIMRGRVAQVPLLRDASGRIAGLNTHAVTNLCDLSQYSTHALRQGADGTLWYGPANPVSPYLFQRSPAGVVTAFALTNANWGAPVDCLFLPGGKGLAVARATGNQMELFALETIGGVATPVYQGPIGATLPACLRSFDLWLDGASAYVLMYQANGQLWLVQTSASALQGGPSSGMESALISDTLNIQALSHDTRSGDVLLLDHDGHVLRMSGYLDYLHTVTLAAPQVANGKLTFRWEAEVGKTYRVQAKSRLSDADWQDVTEFQAASATAEFIENSHGTQECYYRVLLIQP